MKEYIERDVLLSEIKHKNEVMKTSFLKQSLCVGDIIHCINSAATADVAPVVHAKWEPIVIQESYLDPPYCDTCKCSVCEYEIDVSETVYNYCPNCGAKMDGGNK